jgi:8-amino-7-oxononanoate synthase
VSVHGRHLLNFASNDYLGLAHHPQVLLAAQQATLEFGAGATASRLISGSLPPHQQLESALAHFKQTPAALSFSSGYATALGTVPALVGPHDVVILDRLAHACLIDAARLSGARLRVFRHNQVEDLTRILRWARHLPPTPAGNPPHVLVVTESVFSMDGDQAPLADIVAAKDAHDAWLMVDEAHATGILGPSRRGLADAQGVSHRIDIAMGTLGKALGASGGFIAGSQSLVEVLISRARSFLFSTAPPPAAAAAALAAVQLVASPEGERLVHTLWDRIHTFHQGLLQLGAPLPTPLSPILPLHVGDASEALRLAAALADEGLLVPAIRYPTVARRQARLRFTVSAAHTPEDLHTALAAVQRAFQRTGFRPH